MSNTGPSRPRPNGRGNIFLDRCGDECDGRHVHVMIDDEGQPPLGSWVTDAAGARNLAALLCQLADEIERAGLGPRLN